MSKVNRYIYVSGVILLLGGALDPLEGSVIIAIGSLLLAITTYRTNDRHWRFFATSFVLIVAGVISLFYLSALGGFGGKSSLSWWWGLWILPYPIGWLMSIMVLIRRMFHHQKEITSRL